MNLLTWNLCLIGSGVLIGALSLSAWLIWKKNSDKSVHALKTTVDFLDYLNQSGLEKPWEALQEELARHLSEVLRPFHTYGRLWIYNDSWKTLHGVGEHPSLRPGGSRNMPATACPVYTLKKSFHYRQGDTNPCSTEQFNYRAHLCLPVSSDHHMYGVLFLGSYEKKSWSAEETHFFETLAHSIAQTMQRKALFENLQIKIKELDVSSELGSSALASFLGSTLGLDETTIRILDSIRSMLKVDRTTFMIWDKNEQCLRTQWMRGGEFQIQSPMKLAMGEGMAGWALETGHPYWAEYAMSDPHYSGGGRSIQSLLCVPVYAMDHRPLGVINAVTVEQPRTFGDREIYFLKLFGQQAALAIENAQLHQESRAHIEQLKEIDKMKSEFLSLVSHDLRGPLTGIRGFCEVLLEKGAGPLNGAQIELLNQLQKQVDLQERMVEDLLDLARMERGQLSMHKKPGSLTTLVLEEVEKSQSEAREHQVEIIANLCKTSDAPLVLMDESRIRQVIWNLIFNALKFTPEGGKIHINMIPKSTEVMIEVNDTGIGLSNELQERVFDKFFQVSPGGSTSSQGLGLGLTICRQIVQAHQGHIWAKSSGLGKGTTFSFTLPIAKTVLTQTNPSSLAA